MARAVSARAAESGLSATPRRGMGAHAVRATPGGGGGDDAIEALGQLDQGPLPDGFSSVEAGLATLQGLIMWGNVGAGMRKARRAAELEGPASRWRPAVCLGLGVQTYNTGELDECDAVLAESVELGLSRGQWSIASAALAFRSLAAGEAGRVDDQTLLAEQAVHLERERGFEGIEGEAYVALGAALGAQQRFEEALAILELSLGILRPQGHPLSLATGLTTTSLCSRPWLGPGPRPTRSPRRRRFSARARIRGFCRSAWLHSSIRRRPDAEAATGR